MVHIDNRVLPDCTYTKLMGTQCCFDLTELGFLSEKIERALTRQLHDVPLTETIL